MRKKILMLKTAKGADDHIHIHTYLEGKEYEVSTSLANSFINSGDAEEAGKQKEKQSHANKALTGNDYQNKADKPNQSKGDK